MVELPKNEKEFECLMRARAAEYPEKRYIRKISAEIYCDAEGNPEGSDDKQLLCEFSKMALGTKWAWVECGPVTRRSFGLHGRTVILQDPLRELEELGIFLYKLVTGEKKSAKEISKRMSNGSNRLTGGHFCAFGGGCD